MGDGKTSNLSHLVFPGRHVCNVQGVLWMAAIPDGKRANVPTRNTHISSGHECECPLKVVNGEHAKVALAFNVIINLCWQKRRSVFYVDCHVNYAVPGGSVMINARQCLSKLQQGTVHNDLGGGLTHISRDRGNCRRCNKIAKGQKNLMDKRMRD